MEHIYKASDFNAGKHYILQAELPESAEYHCKIMAQLPNVTLQRRTRFQPTHDKVKKISHKLFRPT